MKPPWPQSFWVEPGHLLAGDHPAGQGASQLRVRMAKLLGAGINCFIDLTAPGECPDYALLLTPSLRYHRIPLVDHQVPSYPALMARVLATLQRELDDGRRVYLHCRAGIGRTGMAIGCHLVERGQRGRQALETLNQLWRAHVPPNHWRHIPETEAQDAFIIQWRGSTATATLEAPDFSDPPPPRGAAVEPLPSPAPPPTQAAPTVRVPTVRLRTLPQAEASPASSVPVVPMRRSALRSLPLPLRARARAALLGLALGDMLTAQDLGLAAGSTADDTAMALCAAESLIHCGDFEVRDQIGRFQAWLAEGPAPGARPVVRKAIALASWRRTALAGSHDPQQLSPEALGRCAVAAVAFHADRALALAVGADLARLTHQAPLVVDSCRLLTAMVHEALHGGSRQAVLGVAGRWPSAPLKTELSSLAASWAGGPAVPPPTPGTVLAVLDDAVRAFAAADDFRAGMNLALAAPQDRDVVAAAYGQLAGAFFSLEGIPADWRRALPSTDALGQLVDRLLICRDDSLK